MIMKTLRYIALAALTLSFAACEQEDINPAVQGDPDAVKINATIGALQTRVAYGENGATNFVNGDAIKVVNLMRTSKNEATYTTTDGTNWTTTDAMVWNSSSKNHFQAYYPVAVYSSYDTFTIPTDQSDATKLASADWMTASTEEIDKPGNGVLDLNFQHRLAKVTVNLTFSSQYPKGFQHVSDFTFYTNEATPQAITALANSETSYTAILRPGEYADESSFIYLMMDDFSEHYVLGKTTTSAINLEAGKHYTFTLKVGKDVVSIDDVTVADWEEEDIDGGVAEEILASIDGTEYFSLTELQVVVKDRLSQEGVTSVTIDGCLTDGTHAAIISAINEVKTEGAVTNGSLSAGSVTYTLHTSFADAVGGWTDGVTLTLLSSNASEYKNNVTIENKKIVLDLNGYKLSFNSRGVAEFRIEKNGELTIRDSRGGGEYSAYHFGILVFGTLNIEGGTLHNQVTLNEGDAIINMTGGTLYGYTASGQNTGVSGYGTFNMSGGTISAKYAVNTSTAESFVNISGDAILIATRDLFLGGTETTYTITGGIFSRDPSQWVNLNAYTVTGNSDGTWSVTAKE